jgi:hypothetical protein
MLSHQISGWAWSAAHRQTLMRGCTDRAKSLFEYSIPSKSKSYIVASMLQIVLEFVIRAAEEATIVLSIKDLTYLMEEQAISLGTQFPSLKSYHHPRAVIVSLNAQCSHILSYNEFMSRI